MIAPHRRLEIGNDTAHGGRRRRSASRNAQRRISIGHSFAPARKVQNNGWAVLTNGTSRAHSGSSFSGRLTRVLTGYFFINLASNGLRQSVTRVGSVTP